MRLRFMQILTLNYVLVLLHQTQVSMNASQDIDPPSLCASVFHSIHPETIFNYSIKSNIHQEGFWFILWKKLKKKKKKKGMLDTLHYDLYIGIKRFILKWKEFTSQIKIILGSSPEVHRHWYSIKQIILRQYFQTCRLPYLMSLLIMFLYLAGRKILIIHHSFFALFKLHWNIFRKIIQNYMIELLHSVIIFKNDLLQPPLTFKLCTALFISSNMTMILWLVAKP